MLMAAALDQLQIALPDEMARPRIDDRRGVARCIHADLDAGVVRSVAIAAEHPPTLVVIVVIVVIAEIRDAPA